MIDKEPLREALTRIVDKRTLTFEGDQFLVSKREMRYAEDALAIPPQPSLDAAWAAAEAALPEGWRLGVTRSDEDFDIWQASAVSPALFDGENDNDAECVIGEAVVPAWALLALAARLGSPS